MCCMRRAQKRQNCSALGCAVLPSTERELLWYQNISIMPSLCVHSTQHAPVLSLVLAHSHPHSSLINFLQVSYILLRLLFELSKLVCLFSWTPRLGVTMPITELLGCRLPSITTVVIASLIPSPNLPAQTQSEEKYERVVN